MFSRRALIVVAVLAALAAPAAFAGDYPKQRGAKARSGPFEKGVIPVTVNDKRNLFIKVISVSNQTETWTIKEYRGGVGDSDYSIRWFLGKNDISHDIQTAGRDFKLRAGSSRLFRISIKPQVPSPDGVCVYPALSQGGTPADEVYFGINGNLCN